MTRANSHSPPAVVLVRPREEGNVGAAARAMANCGLSRLILVEPAAELGGIARAFAVGARSILESVERVATLEAALAPFERVIATTSTRDRRVEVPMATARELPSLLAQGGDDLATALVFGPEVGGLANEEMARASLLVWIPCAPAQPTLNLAQAVLLLAYELYQAGYHGDSPFAPIERREARAKAEEVAGLLGHVEATLDRVGFARDSSFVGVLRDLRQLAARAELSSREVAVLRGICRRTERALERSGAPSPREASGD